jgi:hypothetical protein
MASQGKWSNADCRLFLILIKHNPQLYVDKGWSGLSLARFFNYDILKPSSATSYIPGELQYVIEFSWIATAD